MSRNPARLLGLAIAALALTGCLAPDIPYETLEAKYASPASRFTDLPGGLHVHYRDEGPKDAPAVVMVHGFSASLHAWEPWTQRLSGKYRVISLDLPGHGLTRAPAGVVRTNDSQVMVVDRVVERLGVRRFVIVGNSMGGAVAWNFALAHPDKLRGLVLVNAAGFPSEARNEGGPVVFKLLGNPVGRMVLRNLDPRPMAEPGLKQAYGDPALVTPAVVDRYVELARAPGHREILTSGERGSPATRATFAAIRTPTLVMVGDRDEVIPPVQSKGFAGAIPGAKLVIYPDAGHVPMSRSPTVRRRT